MDFCCEGGWLVDPQLSWGEPCINVFVFGKYQIQYEHFICVYVQFNIYIHVYNIY